MELINWLISDQFYRVSWFRSPTQLKENCLWNLLPLCCIRSIFPEIKSKVIIWGYQTLLQMRTSRCHCTKCASTLYLLCHLTILTLSYTSANYRAQQGQQSFGRYQATLHSNGKLLKYTVCVFQQPFWNLPQLVTPKQRFWKETKNLFRGNEIMSNLKQSFTINKQTKKLKRN